MRTQNQRGPLLLALDLGTTLLKLTVYDAALEAVYSSDFATPTLAGSRRGEIPPNDLWIAARAQIANARSRLDVQRIVAIGIAGMAESGFLVGSDNQPLTPMLLWHDRRGIRQAAALRRRAGPEFARLTGLRMTSVRSIAKWRWMIESGAPSSARWCGAPEWLALCLTGRRITDPTLAVRTGVFDVLQGAYAPQLLGLAGAPLDLFPPVSASPARAGPILPQVAHDLGLQPSVQVVIAGHDDVVAAYGAGGKVGDLIDSGGTAEGLVRITDSPPIPAETVRGRMAMTRYFDPGTWALIAGAGSTGALMHQVSQMLGGTPAMLDQQAAPPRQYHEGAIRVRLSKEGLPAVKLNADASSAEVWSAVLDLVSERARRTATRLERLAGRPSRLILIGGAARSLELTRRKSDLLGLASVVLPGVDATTRGAAALAARSID